MPRSFGTTNATPYPAAPAVGPAGDTYFNTTNKTLYLSDGVSWLPTLAGGSAAGGDLTGTYPNPSIAPFAVTAPKIAVASTVRAYQYARVLASLAISTTTTDIVVLPTITTAGGWVFLGTSWCAWLNPGAQAQVGVYLAWQRDGVDLVVVNTSGGGTAPQPLPNQFFFEQAPAGPHVYRLQGTTNIAAASIVTPGALANTGFAWALEFA